MRHTFSSRFTSLHKLSLVALFLLMPCLMVVASLYGRWRRRDATVTSGWEWGWAGLLYVLIGVPGIWSASRLRKVQADDRALYVSYRGTEFKIPLTQVRDVTDGRFFLFYLSPPTVTIHLRSASPLGSEIVFIPPLRLYWTGLHPVAKEFKELAERANGRLENQQLESGPTERVR
jgi:hypothetical protein